MMMLRDHDISIHALREEGDDAATLTLRARVAFLSTPSARRATRSANRSGAGARDFYPRPPRGGRPYQQGLERFWSRISIHALREEGDQKRQQERGGGKGFLSTPSARRATLPARSRTILEQNFYPRPPRGGRRESSRLRARGRDFYPRPPRGGRLIDGLEIALRIIDFYPRPPRGGRRWQGLYEFEVDKFLSTPSARRATENVRISHDGLRISIHALREEGDKISLAHNLYLLKFLSTPSARRATFAVLSMQSEESHFYPRPPRGGRHSEAVSAECIHYISIHALREEGDFFCPSGSTSNSAFLSTPSARRATHGSASTCPSSRYFYPRPPRGGRRFAFLRSRETAGISIHALREEGDPAARISAIAL